MKLNLLLLGAVLLLLPSSALAAGRAPRLPNKSAYTTSISGQVAGFRLAGIEPDGDPLDQVVLRLRLSPSGTVPALNLIVDAYMENFTPDTTPILPDLLHQNQTAQNLGGFLQGKALLTDDAGNAISIGSFLAEAFLDNSNHGVVNLDTGTTSGRLRGIFVLHKHPNSVTVSGSFGGRVRLAPSDRKQVLAHRGARMKPITQIIGLVTVHPAPMMGRNTKGNPNAALRTGYGTAPAASHSGRRLSPLTVAAGAGAVVAFLLAGLLYWTDRRRVQR